MYGPLRWVGSRSKRSLRSGVASGKPMGPSRHSAIYAAGAGGSGSGSRPTWPIVFTAGTGLAERPHHRRPVLPSADFSPREETGHGRSAVTNLSARTCPSGGRLRGQSAAPAASREAISLPLDCRHDGALVRKGMRSILGAAFALTLNERATESSCRRPVSALRDAVGSPRPPAHFNAWP